MIVSLPSLSVSNMSPSHEEVDTRIFLHIKDASEKGCKKVMLKTDTDIIINLPGNRCFTNYVVSSTKPSVISCKSLDCFGFFSPFFGPFGPKRVLLVV